MSITEQLREHDACNDAIEWIEANGITTFAEAWDKCHRADWMLWLHVSEIITIDYRTLRLFACRCVRETPIGNGRTVWDLLTDERSRNAVVVAERYANGEATDEELDAAWDAAWNAAWDAAWNAAGDAASAAAKAGAWDAARAAARDAANSAAWAAAGDAARAFQADLLREMVKNPFKETIK